MRKEEHQFQGVWIMRTPVDYKEEDKGYYEDHPHTIVRKRFFLDDIKDVSVYVGVLGYYLGYVNGKAITQDELNGDWTSYERMVYYDHYDISDLVVIGENEISFALGNGMYHPSPLRLFGKYNLREKLCEVGEPRIVCDLCHKDQVMLSSDASWEYCEGNLLFQNIYLGERIDLRKKEQLWFPVSVDQRKRRMKLGKHPKCRRIKTIHPQQIQACQEGWLYDFGEMITGFLELQIQVDKATTIQVQYAEAVKDGRPDYTSSLAGSVGEWIKDKQITGGMGCPTPAIQTDQITCDAGSHTFCNQFTYHSFRYAYITGCDTKNIVASAIYVHNDVDIIGNFQCNDAWLMQLDDAATRTKLNNLHGTFEDCARERLGYGGDMVALAYSNLYQFDLETMYEKVITDFYLAQTMTGGIPETAPYIGIQTNGTADKEGPLLWQLVYPYLCMCHYQFYGDLTMIKELYPSLQKQLQYLLSFDIKELVQHCIGDHGSVLISGEFHQATPDKELVGYCTLGLFLQCHMYLAEIMEQDATIYQHRLSLLMDLIKERFFHEDETIGEDTQTGYAFVLMLPFPNASQLCKQFVHRIQKDEGILMSGIFAMSFTYRILHRFGYDEIIENWLHKEGKISFHQMLSNGNKALSELFLGEHYSQNHAMFASYQQWFYEALAGITIGERAIGFDQVHIHPYFALHQTKSQAQVATKRGTLFVHWYKEKRKVIYKITIPQNIRYTIEEPQSYHCIHKEVHEDTLTMIYEKKTAEK